LAPRVPGRKKPRRTQKVLRRGRNREEADRCRTLLTADFNQTQIASVGAQIAVPIKEKRTNPSLMMIAGMVEVSRLLYRNVLVGLLFWPARETDYEHISDCLSLSFGVL